MKCQRVLSENKSHIQENKSETFLSGIISEQTDVGAGKHMTSVTPCWEKFLWRMVLVTFLPYPEVLKGMM